MTWTIFSRCEVCASTLKVTSLSQHDQRLIGKLYRVFGKQTSCNGGLFVFQVTEKSCEFCVLNNAPLANLAKKLIVQQHVNGNMQTGPPDPKKSEVTKDPPKSPPHPYNCECHECQIKFGSLPLLVQVIETQEKSSLDKSTASSSPPRPTGSTPQSALSLSEPSTSYAHKNSSTSASSPHKTMTCPHCSKTFTHRGDLNKHVRKHTGEQPYTCHLCKRKFAHTSNLNRHLRMHSGDRPFICSVCNKNFSRKDKFEMHKKTKRCIKFSEKKL